MAHDPSPYLQGCASLYLPLYYGHPPLQQSAFAERSVNILFSLILLDMDDAILMSRQTIVTAYLPAAPGARFLLSATSPTHR